MTDDLQKEYEALFAVIRENAPETKTIVSTEVVASGVVRSGTTGCRSWSSTTGRGQAPR